MNKFDKNIKDKLKGYSSPVNKDLWGKISANLPIQEQSTFKHWWLAMFSIAIVAVGFAWYLSWNHNIIQSNILKEDQKTADLYEFDSPTTEESGGVKNDTDLELSASSKTTIEQKAAASNMLQKLDLSNSNRTKTDVTNKSKLINKKVSLTTNADVFNTNLNVIGNYNSLDDQREIFDLKTTEKNVASLYEQYNTIVNKAKNLEFLKNNDQERLDLEEIDVLTYEIPQLNDDTNFEELLQSMSGKRLICPSFSNARFGVFIEGYYSNEISMRELSYNGPISEVDYLNVRNQTENSNYSYSAGMRLSFLLPMGFGAKTGVNYSQINETFKYVDPNSNRTQTVIIKEYIWENGVVTDSSEMTKQVSIPGSLNVVSQNKYKILDIPLLFTYEWGYKKRMYYSVTAGPMFNLKFAQKGKFLNPETLTPVDFTTNTGDYKAFNTNIGTSIYLGFALNYQLGHGTDIFVEPNLRHYLNKTTLNSYLLNQKYTTIGIGFGVKHKI